MALGEELLIPQAEKSSDTPTFGAKLDYLGAIITTIGDIISTVATRILIEEGLAESLKETGEKMDQEVLLINMQSQIEDLQREIKLLQKTKD